MRVTIEPEEVELAVLAYVQAQFPKGADVRIVRFARTRDTGLVSAEVIVEHQIALAIEQEDK